MSTKTKKATKKVAKKAATKARPPRMPKSAARADGAARTDRLRKATLAKIQERLAESEKPAARKEKGSRGGVLMARGAVTHDDTTPESKGKAAVASTPVTVKRVSSLDAAAQVLAEKGQPMRSTELIAEMAARKLWTSPAGKTPDVSLATAMSREIKAKGEKSRFVKTGPGLFAAAKVA